MNNKRITYEFIKEAFEEENYILLSKEYKNARTKLNYICSNGHTHAITWDKWKQNNRCPYCYGNVKHTYAFINNSFESDGYKILSNVYINSGVKIKYRCSVGHTHSITWDGWKQGHRCPTCATKAIAMHNRKNIDDIRDSFKKENYILLSTTYNNNKQKLKYRCPNGHIHSITWADWNSGGYRCPQCAVLRTAGNLNNFWKGGVIQHNLPLYDTYAPQLNYAEEVRPFINKDNIKLLGVKCTKCNKWFIPKRSAVITRISALVGRDSGRNRECRFYCSEECKNVCGIYRKRINCDINTKQKEYSYTQEELQIWSQEVMTRANYACEICGEPVEHAHHIQPKKLEPGLALDPENGVALCRNCHHKYGHSDECSTGKLANTICK